MNVGRDVWNMRSGLLKIGEGPCVHRISHAQRIEIAVLRMKTSNVSMTPLGSVMNRIQIYC